MPPYPDGKESRTPPETRQTRDADYFPRPKTDSASDTWALFTGNDLAERVGRDAGVASRTLPLAFLAPDIVEAILAGRQPAELTARQLHPISDLPTDWSAQKARRGFEV